MAASDLSSFVPTPESAGARTRVTSGQTSGLRWEAWQRDPPPQLAGSILGLWAGSDPLLGARHRVLPNGELSLMLTLGGAQHLVECQGAACDQSLGAVFVSGLQERPSTYLCTEPGTRVVAARITPLGAWRLLAGLPQRELLHGVFDLEAILGTGAWNASLRERMLDVDDLGEALDLLESWLIARMANAPAPHPGLAHALGRLSRSPDAPGAQAIAGECQLSPRRLRELFNDEIGIPAKRLARILRFRRVLDSLATRRAPDLAELALSHGYYDQPHLNREFRELAGMTPRRYLRALGEGLDGPDVVQG
jgi:AraC-like DNA-binding protein